MAQMLKKQKLPLMHLDGAECRLRLKLTRRNKVVIEVRHLVVQPQKQQPLLSFEAKRFIARILQNLRAYALCKLFISLP